MARATAAMKPTGRFRLEAEGPYSLSASIRFLEGFVVASYGGEDADRLRMAFVVDGLDGGERVAGVLVRSDRGSGVTVDTYGEAAPEAVRGQLERILSLDEMPEKRAPRNRASARAPEIHPFSVRLAVP